MRRLGGPDASTTVALPATILLALAFATAPARAQSGVASAPATPSAPADTSKTGPDKPAAVEVVGHTGGFRASIDRRSYDLSKDLQATSGSVADALRNIPSVDVDPNGNVSLRGDSNVTIMVDGKVSALYRGATAGQALQSLPASQIERVEVITNPSAEFSPEGTAGIINLITKKTRTAGVSGLLRGNIGTASRSNGGAVLAYKTDRLTVNGSVILRHDPQHNKDIEQQTLFDASGQPTLLSRQEQRGAGRLDSRSLNGSVDYDLDPATRISGQLTRAETGYADHNTIHFDGDIPSGALVESFGELKDLHNIRSDTTEVFTLRRQLPGEAHELVLSLSHEDNLDRDWESFTQSDTLPAPGTIFQGFVSHVTSALTQFDASYAQPVGKARLKLGYSMKLDEDGYDNTARIGISSAAAVVDPTQADLFGFGQMVQAAFATYEQPLDKWTALFGLRLETVHLAVDDITGAAKTDQDYTRLYPTLHLAYQLDADRQFILAYSHRLNRPTPQDFNPFRYEQDPLHFLQGNANLKPQETDSYEAGYQYKRTGVFYLATLYYRRNENGVTNVVTELPGGALLTTRENLTRSQSAGLELSASGQIVKSLTYTLSSNSYWTEIDASGLGFPNDRSAWTVSGKGSLSWQLARQDLIQFNVTVVGKRLTPQGYIDPMVLTLFGYRHKFNDSWALTIQANDLLNSWRQRTVIDTAILHDRLDDSAHIQAAYIGVTYTFGQGAPKPGFDFGG